VAVRLQGHGQQIAAEVQDVLEIVLPAEGGDALVEDDLEVLGAQTVGTHQPDVEVDVLRQWRGRHAARERLQEQEARLVAELRKSLISGRPSPPDQLVADVERGVGPGALTQVLDDRGDPAVSLDEQHVALADVLLQRLEVVPAVPLVGGQRLGEEVHQMASQPAAKPHCAPPDSSRRQGLRDRPFRFLRFAARCS
jgi:hypothetical protein